MSLISQKLCITLMLLFAAISANAHQVWLEQGTDDAVNIYLGEPGVPDTGDKIDSLKEAKVFLDKPGMALSITKKNDHWEAQSETVGNVYLFSDSIWEPWEIGETSWWEFWKSEEPSFEAAIVEARLGRQQTQAKLNFELMPSGENGNSFIAEFKGKALSNQTVSVLTPSKNQMELATDDNGQINLDFEESGSYMLVSEHTEESDATVSDKKVSSLLYITTISFIVEESEL